MKSDSAEKRVSASAASQRLPKLPHPKRMPAHRSYPMELKISIDLEAALAQALAPEKLQPILDKHIIGAITSALTTPRATAAPSAPPSRNNLLAQCPTASR